MDEEPQPYPAFFKFFYEVIKKFLNTQKIQLYDIQRQALEFINLNDNTCKNLLVSALTGAGKSLVFKMTFLKYLHEHHFSQMKQFQPEDNSQKQNSVESFKVIFIAPTRAVCDQKFKDFDKICQLLKLHHKICLTAFKLSSQSSRQNDISEIYKNNNVFICTPEMANVLYRITFGFGLSSPNLFLCDEIHLLGQKSRGSILEMMLTKALLDQQQYTHLRIVCVSATIQNKQELAEWNNGKLIFSQIRQVPLKFIPQQKIFSQRFVENQQYRMQNSYFSALKVQFSQYRSIFGHYQERYLIFCSSKRIAKDACNKMFLKQNTYLKVEFRRNDDLRIKVEVDKLIKEIHDENLRACVQKRVAYHHAQLRPNDKNSVIQLMRKGWVLAIFCTSTLAQGVNLPVQVVIVMGLNKREQIYTQGELEQMIGRGGRDRDDRASYCTLIAHRQHRQLFEQQIKSYTEKDTQKGSIFISQQIKSNAQQHFDEFVLFQFATTTGSFNPKSFQLLKRYFKYSLWAKQLKNGRSEAQVEANINNKLKQTEREFQAYDLTGKILSFMYYSGISLKSYKYLFRQISQGQYQGGFNQKKFLKTICNVDQIITKFRHNVQQDNLGQFTKSGEHRIMVPYIFQCRQDGKVLKYEPPEQHEEIRRKKHRSKAVFLIQAYLKGAGNNLQSHLFEEAEQIARVLKRVCTVCQKIYSQSSKYKQNERKPVGFVFWNEVYLKYLSLLPKGTQITKDNYLQREKRASHLNIPRCWQSIMPKNHTPQQIKNLSKMKNQKETQNNIHNFFQIKKQAFEIPVGVLQKFDLRRQPNQNRTYSVESEQELKYFVFEKENDTFKLCADSNGFEKRPKIQLKQTNNKQYVLIVYKNVLGTDAIYTIDKGQKIKKFQFPEKNDNGDGDSDGDDGVEKPERGRRRSRSRSISSSLNKALKKVKK